MKIIAKIKINGTRPGAPVDVEDDYGRALIARKLAKEVKVEKPKPKAKGPEE